MEIPDTRSKRQQEVNQGRGKARKEKRQLRGRSNHNIENRSMHEEEGGGAIYNKNQQKRGLGGVRAHAPKSQALRIGGNFVGNARMWHRVPPRQDSRRGNSCFLAYRATMAECSVLSELALAKVGKTFTHGRLSKYVSISLWA